MRTQSQKYLSSTSIFSLLIVINLVSSVQSATEFDAYRLIQYQNAQTELFGSQSNNLNFAAEHFKGDVFRKIALIHFEDLFEGAYFNIMVRNPMGLVVILPSQNLAKLNQKFSKQLEIWEKMQILMSTQKIDIPVYFVYENKKIMNLYETLLENSKKNHKFEDFSKYWEIQKQLGDEGLLRHLSQNSEYFGRQNGIRKILSGTNETEYKLITSNSEPKLLSSLSLDVFYSVLNFKEQSELVQVNEQNPIIAISTTYDALAISPDLSFSLENGGSSLLVQFELQRLFADLIRKQEENKGFNAAEFKYDILFILSPTGATNQEGSQKFIDHLVSNIKERIKLVICLESLSNIEEELQKNLYVILNDETNKNELVTQTIQEFKNLGKQNKVTINVKELNEMGMRQFRRQFVQYEHQVYEEKSIPSFTLTSKPNQYNHRYQKYSAFDRQLSKEDVQNNLRIIAQALLNVIYGNDEKTSQHFSQNPQLLNETFTTQMLSFLNENPRSPVHIQRGSKVHKEIQQIISDNLGQQNVKRMGISLKDIQFFEEKQEKTKISIQIVTSKLLELYIFLGILAYLIGLYLAVQKYGGDEQKEKKNN